MNLFKLIMCCIVMSGCSSLVIRPENSVPKKIAKGFTRFVLVFPSIGLSEVAMADERDEYRKELTAKEMDQILLRLQNGGTAGEDNFTKDVLRFQELAREYKRVHERQVQRSEALNAFAQSMNAATQNFQAAQAYEDQRRVEENRYLNASLERQQIINELSQIRQSIR